MELYYKLKLIFIIIPIAVSAIIFIILSIAFVVATIKEKMVEHFFISHGYKRELLGVPSVGNGAFYGWVRESDHKIADDRDIKCLSLKQIKNKCN